MNISTTFIPHAKPSELMKPRYCPLDDPSCFPQSAAMFCAAAGGDRCDSLGAQHPAVWFGVIGPVSLDAVRAVTRFSALSVNTGNGLYQWQQLGDIVRIGSRKRKGKRNTIGIAQNVMLAPRLATVRGIGTRFLPPKTARTEELSTTARDQSIALAPRKAERSAAWTCAQTPSFCQSRRRRQQVIPLPYPSSWGRSSQGMPVRKTNSIPISTLRLGIGGRPLLRTGLSGGSKGSNRSHISSGRIIRAIDSLLYSPCFCLPVSPAACHLLQLV